MIHDENTRITELKQQLERLEKTLEQKEAERLASEQKLISMKRTFQAVTESKAWQLTKSPHQIKRLVRSSGAYVLGRRNRKELYSKAYRRKKAANELKKYTYHLYELGFTKKALADMEHLLQETRNRYMKQASAWELALWHANKYTKTGASQALSYIPQAKHGETGVEQRRKIAIIEAECLLRLNEHDQANTILKETMEDKEHPDLYLAMANNAETLDERINWINQALDVYQIPPITFQRENGNASYDDLATLPIEHKVHVGPKVSVIIPAYNASEGIGTAIESIQTQTWQNLEILVVDDCSTDHTVDVVKSYMETDQRIKLLTTQTNSGAYIARNIALKAATGDYVTINDSDDWSHAKKIEIQANHLMRHSNKIANTSEHARFLEDLTFYRRGRPGSYIFTNMSSLMFKREPVMEKVGYWDKVRFAADSEFIRRIKLVFGEEAIDNLNTGPLSLPRQSVNSLTGSSKFGYNGFLMGVRKEYAEAHRYYHSKAEDLYYPFTQLKRPFPVPAPMWPKRAQNRRFDVVIAADFRNAQEATIAEIKANQEKGLRTGLVQLAVYDPSSRQKKAIPSSIRKLINGDTVQMLVYGEKITSEVLLVKDPAILKEKQKYIPTVQAMRVNVVIEKLPTKGEKLDLRNCARNLAREFGKRGKWYPHDSEQRELLATVYKREAKSINVSSQNWASGKKYIDMLDHWLVEKNPYIKG